MATHTTGDPAWWTPMSERSWTPSRASVIALAVSLTLAWATLRALWPSLAEFVISIDHCGLLFCDYARHYAPMGSELFETRVPGRGFYYSPLFALGMWALVALPAPVQFWSWAVLQVGSGVLLVWITARRFGGATPWVGAGYLFVFATSLPVLNNFKWGQLSVLMILCMVASLVALEHRRRGLAAGLLAFAISIKFYPALLLIYGIARREWRFTGLTLAASALLLLGIPAAALGLGDTLGFYLALNPLDPFGTTGIAQNANSQYFGHVVNRLFPAVGSEPARALGYGVAAANVWLVLQVSRTRRDPGPVALALLMLSIPFVLRTSWPHYFVYLPPLQLLALGWTRERMGAMRALLGVLVTASVVLSSALLFDLTGRAAYGEMGFLWGSNALLLLAVWIHLLARDRNSSNDSASNGASGASLHSDVDPRETAPAINPATRP